MYIMLGCPSFPKCRPQASWRLVVKCICDDAIRDLDINKDGGRFVTVLYPFLLIVHGDGITFIVSSFDICIQEIHTCTHTHTHTHTHTAYWEKVKLKHII